MSLAALDDIAVHSGSTDPIDKVVRIETSPLEQTAPMFMAKMRSAYPHEDVFGQYCTVNDYVDCPPDRSPAGWVRTGCSCKGRRTTAVRE